MYNIVLCVLPLSPLFYFMYCITAIYLYIYTLYTRDGVYIIYAHTWAGVEKIRRRARHDLMGCHKSPGRPVCKDIMTADVDRRPRIAVNKRAADVVSSPSVTLIACRTSTGRPTPATIYIHVSAVPKSSPTTTSPATVSIILLYSNYYVRFVARALFCLLYTHTNII